MASLFGYRKNQKGQMLVEVALVLPILFVLLFGTIQFGVIYYGNINLTTAVREGARMASVGEPDEAVIYKINSLVDANPFMDVSNIEISPTQRDINDEVIVKGDASINIFVPFLNKAIGDTFDISRSTSMIYQGSF